MLAAGCFVVSWSVDTASRIEILERTGQRRAAPALGDAVSILVLHARSDSAQVFLGTTGFDHRLRAYRLDVGGELTPLPGPPGEVGSPVVATERRTGRSADGTAVPMSVVRRADLPGGPHPTLLYGYGGFDIGLSPTFSALFAAWIQAGGVLAVANLRGGGEFGARWHEAGMGHAKQRVFDDLFGCAESLIADGITSAGQLAVHGRSNGGLLVGAAITQRPELFAAALPTVGVLDMLRFHLFTIGWAWTSEYGDPDDPERFPSAARLLAAARTARGGDLPTDAGLYRRPRRPGGARAFAQVRRPTAALPGRRRPGAAAGGYQGGPWHGQAG